MFKWILVGIMVIHGLIHLVGTLMEFEIMEFEDMSGKTLVSLSDNTKKVVGVIWLVIVVLFLISSYSLATDQDWWQELTIISIILSQILIIIWWHDAKFGTIANVLIIAGMVREG